MIKKVLIAEDHESANLSVQKTLEELGIKEPEYVYYCDDALAKIQRGVQSNSSYDLLITDLYFEADGRVQEIHGGEELIKAARAIQPDLKIIVFSAENKPATIEKLYEELYVDGYVRKARNDAKELRTAFDSISRNLVYRPRHVVQQINNKNAHEFTSYDITIITLLADGVRQKDIPAQLEQQQIKPSGLSSMEKRLNHIKYTLDFSNNEQLIAYCKDNGII